MFGPHSGIRLIEWSPSLSINAHSFSWSASIFFNKPLATLGIFATLNNNWGIAWISIVGCIKSLPLAIFKQSTNSFERAVDSYFCQRCASAIMQVIGLVEEHLIQVNVVWYVFFRPKCMIATCRLKSCPIIWIEYLKAVLLMWKFSLNVKSLTFSWNFILPLKPLNFKWLEITKLNVSITTGTLNYCLMNFGVSSHNFNFTCLAQGSVPWWLAH